MVSQRYLVCEELLFYFRWDRLSMITVSVHVQVDGHLAVFRSFTREIMFLG